MVKVIYVCSEVPVVNLNSFILTHLWFHVIRTLHVRTYTLIDNIHSLSQIEQVWQCIRNHADTDRIFVRLVMTDLYQQ